MGPGKPAYWGPLESLFSTNDSNLKSNRSCIFVTPGCGSSLHDRAVEIFYQIKGGKVDYGEEHSKLFGHSRYGREYPGLYSEWSVSKPLHFLGHSLGGTTIWKLQQLLASDIFPSSYNAHPDMIRSLTAVSSPFKGTQGVYLLGATTKRNGEIRPFSFGCWLGRFVHLYEYFDIKWLKKVTYDFNVDHWNFNTIKSTKINPFSTISEYLINIFQSKKVKDSNYLKEREGDDEMVEIDESLNKNSNNICVSKHGLLKCLFKSPWLYFKDNAPYDMTIHAMNDLNSTNPITKFHKPSFSFSLPLAIYFLSYGIGRFRFQDNTISSEDHVPPPLSQEELHKWYENDGVCPKISQSHPHYKCEDGLCKHFKGLPSKENECGYEKENFEAGKWYVWEKYPRDTTFSVP
ncbi:24742_t:CDS:2 [Entrophospora sp. SA101]|nr:24742_t:CDS:2 [Entrophospora sp. SA101]